MIHSLLIRGKRPCCALHFRQEILEHLIPAHVLISRFTPHGRHVFSVPDLTLFDICNKRGRYQMSLKHITESLNSPGQSLILFGREWSCTKVVGSIHVPQFLISYCGQRDAGLVWENNDKCPKATCSFGYIKKPWKSSAYVYAVCRRVRELIEQTKGIKFCFWRWFHAAKDGCGINVETAGGAKHPELEFPSPL
jgi:hypothetical protein